MGVVIDNEEVGAARRGGRGEPARQVRPTRTIQKAIDRPLMRSPIPPQLASLEHRYVMMSGMHGVPLRCSSVHTQVLMMCCIK